MADPFPHRYEAHVKLEAPGQGLLSGPGLPPLRGGPPPQFGGAPGLWSPEHLLLSAANLCLMTTFLSVAARARLSVSGYESRAAATLDKTAEGLVFTEIALEVSVWVAEPDREKAETLLVSAKKYCIVSNALKVPVAVKSTVIASLASAS